MGGTVDIDEVSGCTCLRVRRAARRLTQLYDQALKPSGLTVNQFGVMANLFGAALHGEQFLPIGILAGRLSMHPTTLNRDLKPLLAQGLVADMAKPRDRRMRAVGITRKGRTRFGAAIPLWREAQRAVEAALGAGGTRDLNALLEAVAGQPRGPSGE